MTKKILLIIMGLFSLFGCGRKDSLTQTETELLKKIDFKSDLMAEIKELTNSDLKQLPAIDQETGDVLSNKFYNGIFSETTQEKANEFVVKMKPKFRENGYLIFVFEAEESRKNVAVLKGQDELDILRYRRTDGINYDLENDDIIKKISEWQSKYGLVLIGCSRDWLHVVFDKLPANLDAFADEVYEFCPDSVDQGVGSVDELKKAIYEMKGVWLWWD